MMHNVPLRNSNRAPSQLYSEVKCNYDSDGLPYDSFCAKKNRDVVFFTYVPC